jgi:hypothetical protein
MVQKMGKELEYQMRDIDFDQKSEWKYLPK